jgi:transcriptional regulator with XRE-family HTH domain
VRRLHKQLAHSKKTFAEKVRIFRLATGMTQEDFGNILGVTKSMISQYEDENNPKFPEIERVIAISVLLSLSLDCLLGLKEEM